MQGYATVEFCAESELQTIERSSRSPKIGTLPISGVKTTMKWLCIHYLAPSQMFCLHCSKFPLESAFEPRNF